MAIALKEYITTSGEIILYIGTPDFDKLNELSQGSGDIWHSSFEQGYKNAFPEIVYFAFVFFWYINDFEGLNECVSWRINPNQFAIRKSVWEQLGGFDTDFKSIQMQAFDFGYNCLENSGAIPMYCKGLFTDVSNDKVVVTATDRYVFYRKNFKIDHSLFMLYRKGFWKWSEWKAFLYAKNNFVQRALPKKVPPRALNQIQGKPTVSYIIPTMLRQEFTVNLLNDLAQQSYLPSQVIVVDATPEEKRNIELYQPENYPFEVQFIWQQSKGSCRARNEAIDLCTGDYIVFGDDDIRIPADFIENHIRLLQTYNAGACNGLDITADHQKQNLSDLEEKLVNYEYKRWHVGATLIFSNANSCVKREYVNKLIGNDINFDGGYGEDGDFGLSLVKMGVMVLHNPFSPNLHLKPPAGGYRFWGAQAKMLGKKRKTQPWELDTPVKLIRPVPSPTVMYMIVKQYNQLQCSEFKYKYFFLYLYKGSKLKFFNRLLNVPLKLLQYNKSVFYAKKLLELGVRTK